MVPWEVRGGMYCIARGMFINQSVALTESMEAFNTYLFIDCVYQMNISENNHVMSQNTFRSQLCSMF